MSCPLPVDLLPVELFLGSFHRGEGADEHGRRLLGSWCAPRRVPQARAHQNTPAVKRIACSWRAATSGFLPHGIW
jgi:hypothetical protein